MRVYNHIAQKRLHNGTPFRSHFTPSGEYLHSIRALGRVYLLGQNENKQETFEAYWMLQIGCHLEVWQKFDLTELIRTPIQINQMLRLDSICLVCMIILFNSQIIHLSYDSD